MMLKIVLLHYVWLLILLILLKMSLNRKDRVVIVCMLAFAAFSAIIASELNRYVLLSELSNFLKLPRAAHYFATKSL